MSKILQVENLVQEFNLTKDFLDKVKFKNGHFSLENRVVHAVNNVSFDVEEGEVFSLVGESGCGKSTTARTIIKLIEPKSGKIIFDGRDITRLKPQEMRPIRREMQMIFQDPYASLNPRQRIMEILTDPMLFHKLCSSKAEAEEKAIHLLERVGLSSEQANRCESHARYVQGTSALRACTSNRPSKGAHMAIAIDIPHTPIVSVQKSYNRSMTTENNKNSRFEMRLT